MACLKVEKGVLNSLAIHIPQLAAWYPFLFEHGVLPLVLYSSHVVAKWDCYHLAVYIRASLGSG